MPETLDVPVPRRPPLTANALPAGVEVASSASLKDTVSVVPFTAAEAKTGAVSTVPLTRIIHALLVSPHCPPVKRFWKFAIDQPGAPPESSLKLFVSL